MTSFGRTRYTRVLAHGATGTAVCERRARTDDGVTATTDGARPTRGWLVVWLLGTRRNPDSELQNSNYYNIRFHIRWTIGGTRYGGVIFFFFFFVRCRAQQQLHYRPRRRARVHCGGEKTSMPTSLEKKVKPTHTWVHFNVYLHDNEIRNEMVILYHYRRYYRYYYIHFRYL